MKACVLAVIPARAGSKGLPGKCVASLCGRPLIEYTIDHAVAAGCLGGICVTTDSAIAAGVAEQRGVFVVHRPAELATDQAPVDAAVRHAVESFEHANDGFHSDVVVILYASIPIRAPGLVDRAVTHLIQTGADSVRSVAPVGKHHPDWLHRLDGDRMQQFRPNHIHRRQDLDPLYYHDGAVIAVTRAALYSPPRAPDDHHAFFGQDRRAIIQSPDDAIDVDTELDLIVAEALLNRDGHGPEQAKYPALGTTTLEGSLRADATRPGVAARRQVHRKWALSE
ncbi:MAG: acylneuraminate cytidylyltransferase family protein [Phycisphaerae bacterium]